MRGSWRHQCIRVLATYSIAFDTLGVHLWVLAMLLQLTADLKCQANKEDGMAPAICTAVTGQVHGMHDAPTRNDVHCTVVDKACTQVPVVFKLKVNSGQCQRLAGVCSDCRMVEGVGARSARC